MNISETNFVSFCMKYYENHHCSDIEEFEEDLKRVLHIKKLFTKYRVSGDLRERLILNHITILYNVFGNKATEILFFKLWEYRELLKPFIQFLNYLPERVVLENRMEQTSSIKSDEIIVLKLKEIFK